MSSDLLTVNNFAAYYETLAGSVKAVDGVDFTVGKKEIFGIAGESGSGKSTLARAILRLLEPPAEIKHGEVMFGDTDLASIDEEALRGLRGSQITYIPQSSMNALNPVMKVGKQFADVILTHNKWSRAKTRELTERLLRLVGLSAGCADMYPHELSGGMRQRAVISISMILHPQLIVADEITTALDVVTQRGILQALTDVRDDFGASIISITHDLAVHAEIADRLLVMYAGKVAEIGAINELFDDPLHPYSQVLVASIPSIEDRKVLKELVGRPPNLIDPPSGCRFHPRCPKALEICSKVEPPMVTQSERRFVSCHLYGET